MDFQGLDALLGDVIDWELDCEWPYDVQSRPQPSKGL